ncbi:hypothetical protein TWF730_009019 [Orbilia blumenaviensis]|uniref:Uncharacterized protein n=1 Tax=Orbilia blumenaviensis TaxID=1796055 RepID=A0AAV9UYD2_9PEZI
MSSTDITITTTAEIGTTVIDSEGDIYIECEVNRSLVGILRVSSKILSLVSAELQEEIGHRCAQSKDSTVKSVVLRPESLDSLIFIMRIIHFKTTYNPKSLSLQKLYEIAIFCERYSCQEAMGPSAEIWARPLWSEEEGEEKKCNQHLEDYPRWLMIAKIFKMEDIVKSLAKDAVFNIRLNLYPDSYMINNKPFHALEEPNSRVPADMLVDKPYLTAIKFAHEGLLDEQLRMIENTHSMSLFRDTIVKSSRCMMVGIGILYNVKLQLTSPWKHFDGATLSHICENIRQTCDIAQTLKDCPHRVQGSTPGGTCVIPDLMSDTLKIIEDSDPREAILRAAGLRKSRGGECC